jgi:glycosyltransferase involved in cell wall biosynthesis
VRASSSELGLEDRVQLAGELDADSIADCYNTADVFVLATLQETYGMAVAEALAHGLPVVSTTTGAIPSLVGTEAGILVPPGDADALVGRIDSSDWSMRHLRASSRTRAPDAWATVSQRGTMRVRNLQRV